MQTSVSRCFELEIRNVRGLTDYREYCQCGRNCGNLLPISDSFRIEAPFLSDKGEILKITRGCLMAMIIEGDPRFPPEAKELIKVIYDMLEEFDENNKKNNIKAYDLACEDNLHAINKFASNEEARREEEVEKYNKAKEKLIKLVFSRKNGKKKKGYLRSLSLEEQRKQSRELSQRHRNTVRFHEPERVFLRNLINIRWDTFNRGKCTLFV